MSSVTRSLLCYAPAVLLLTSQTAARHTHHHHVRQVAVAVPIISADPSPTTTIQATRVPGQASSEVISDKQDTKEGIEDPPTNLLSYIQSVEQRLETVEDLLQSLLSSATPTSVANLPSGPALPTISTRAGPAPFTASEAAPSSAESLMHMASASIQPITLPTALITSIETSAPSLTRHMPIPVPSTSAVPRPFSYAPIGNGTLAMPTAGSASSTGTKVVTRTVAVIPVPSTITLSGLTGLTTPTTFATLIRTA